MLSKNVTWSLLGGALPALAALICTPYLFSVLSAEQFAITSLILSGTIFFYVFDFGMSKSMTFLIAKAAHNKLKIDVFLVGSAMMSTLILGLIITVLGYLLVPFFINHWMNIEHGLREEATLAFEISVLSFVPSLISNTLKGILEGRTQFKEANICKTVSGASIFLAPIIVIYFLNRNLVDISIAIVISRYVSLLLYVVYAIPKTTIKLLRVSLEHLNIIWTYAVWAAISGFISTSFVYGDRFVVAGFLEAHDLSLYIASQDILIRYLLIPWSMAIVLMPTFSANAMEKSEVTNLYFSQQKRVAVMSLLLLSFAFICSIFVNMFVDFSIPLEKFYAVILIQIIGIFFGAQSQLPLIYLFGKGKPRLITKIFILELIVYVMLAPFAFKYYGLVGACLIWSGRLVMEYFLLSYYAKRLMRVI